jgi:hypothetical protein
MLRLRVIGHRFQDPAVHLDRAERVVQLQLEQLAGAIAERDRGVGIRSEIGLALQHGEQLFEATGGAV